MLKQFCYSTRERLPVRLTALLIMLGVNLLFVLLTSVLSGMGVMITAVTFSSLALAYLIMANMFVSFAGIHEVFSAPKGYHTLLAPVPGWKIILGRVIPSAVIDVAMMAVGIPLVVWHSLRLAGVPGSIVTQYGSFAQDVLFGGVAAMAGYALILLAYCFFRVISRSLLHRLPLSNLLGVLLTIAAFWVVTSLSNLLLLPFGRVEIWGPVVHIALYPSPIVRLMVVLVLLLPAAVFFAASARLMERKVNV